MDNVEAQLKTLSARQDEHFKKIEDNLEVQLKAFSARQDEHFKKVEDEIRKRFKQLTKLICKSMISYTSNIPDKVKYILVYTLINFDIYYYTRAYINYIYFYVDM